MPGLDDLVPRSAGLPNRKQLVDNGAIVEFVHSSVVIPIPFPIFQVDALDALSAEL
jgi:hypothetical protein